MYCSADEGEEEMVDQEGERNAEIKSPSNVVATALTAANALGSDGRKASADQRLDDVAAGLAELDMDNYDNENEGRFFHLLFIFIRLYL